MGAFKPFTVADQPGKQVSNSNRKPGCGRDASMLTSSGWSETIRTNSSVRIVSDQPDEVSIDASLPQPGFLLLLDTCFPGWSATVNGLKAPILRADYNFRAVWLPAGKSVIRFTYQPN